MFLGSLPLGSRTHKWRVELTQLMSFMLILLEIVRRRLNALSRKTNLGKWAMVVFREGISRSFRGRQSKRGKYQFTRFMLLLISVVVSTIKIIDKRWNHLLIALSEALPPRDSPTFSDICCQAHKIWSNWKEKVNICWLNKRYQMTNFPLKRIEKINSKPFDMKSEGKNVHKIIPCNFSLIARANSLTFETFSFMRPYYRSDEPN
jgi:hypothetical protein